MTLRLCSWHLIVIVSFPCWLLECLTFTFHSRKSLVSRQLCGLRLRFACPLWPVSCCRLEIHFIFPFLSAVYESGDDVSQLADQSCLLVGNHQNTCDVPSLLAWLATKSGVPSRVMWVMDVMFKFSHFGMVSNCHRDFFIQSVSLTPCLHVHVHCSYYETRPSRS